MFELLLLMWELVADLIGNRYPSMLNATDDAVPV